MAMTRTSSFLGRKTAAELSGKNSVKPIAARRFRGLLASRESLGVVSRMKTLTRAECRFRKRHIPLSLYIHWPSVVRPASVLLRLQFASRWGALPTENLCHAASRSESQLSISRPGRRLETSISAAVLPLIAGEGGGTLLQESGNLLRGIARCVKISMGSESRTVESDSLITQNFCRQKELPAVT